MKPLETIIVRCSLIIGLLLLAGCPRDREYQYTKIPQVEECRFLSRSIFCTDSRLNNTGVNKLIQYVDSQRGLTARQREELITYFRDNRETIIRAKEFEIPLTYSAFFRGYLLIPPADETTLKNFVDGKLLELDTYIDRFGPL